MTTQGLCYDSPFYQGGRKREQGVQWDVDERPIWVINRQKAKHLFEAARSLEMEADKLENEHTALVKEYGI